jgi:hypothetical protein
VDLLRACFSPVGSAGGAPHPYDPAKNKYFHSKEMMIMKNETVRIRIRLTEEEKEKLVFEVADLQQMEDPMEFIERTKDQYPGLNLEDVRLAFEEVKEEMLRLEEENNKKGKKTKTAEQ